METTKLKKEVKFYFENQESIIVDISSPEELSDDHIMYGIHVQQLHANYQNQEHDTLDPQKWVDDYNDWDIEEGNVAKKETGKCLGYTIYIDEEYLRQNIEKAIKEVSDFGLSGWGVALHLHHNMEITISNIIQNNTWSESDDFIEILRINTWNVDYDIHKWATEVEKNQYSKNDLMILKEINSLKNSNNFDINNLSKLAKEDYEDAYQIQRDEDISNMTDYYIEKLKKDYKYGEFKYLVSQ